MALYQASYAGEITVGKPKLSIIKFHPGSTISKNLSLFRNQEFYGKIHRFLFLFSQFLMTG